MDQNTMPWLSAMEPIKGKAAKRMEESAKILQIAMSWRLSVDNIRNNYLQAISIFCYGFIATPD